MLGVKQVDEPVAPEYLDVLKEQYEKVTGESFGNIVKHQTIL